MNRKKIENNLDKSKKPIISELQDSLLMIKESYRSNELIVNKLQEVTQNEEQASLYNALQKDMKLINDQLNTILDNLKTVKSTENRFLLNVYLFLNEYFLLTSVYIEQQS